MGGGKDKSLFFQYEKIDGEGHGKFLSYVINGPPLNKFELEVLSFLKYLSVKTYVNPNKNRIYHYKFLSFPHEGLIVTQ